MSLPSFLITTAAPASSSTFAAPTGFATNARTTGEGGDFRHALSQMTRGQITKGQMADGTASAAAPSPDADSSSVNILKKLANGEILTPADQELLQNLVAEMELTPEIRDALAMVLQNATANLPELDASLEGQPMSLKAIVDLLAGGKNVPDENSGGATNLTDEQLAADAEISPFLFFNPALSNLGSDGLTEQGMDLDFAQRTKVLEGLSLSLSQTRQGINPDSAQPAKTLDGVLTNQSLSNSLLTEESPDLATSLAAKFLAGTSEATGKPEALSFSSGAFILADAAQPDDASIGQTSLATALSKSALEQFSALEQSSALAPSQSMRLQMAFGNAQWSEALAERAAWLASQQIHSAELQLDPPELGPLQVRISVHQDQAVVSFVSANPQVRDALDQSMARLRELLQDQGMQLMDAGVSDQRRDDSGETAATDHDEQQGATSDIAAENSAAATAVVLEANYGVDDFV